MVASRFALAAVDGILNGASDEMVTWVPTISGGADAGDPSVRRFPLEQVLAETKALVENSSIATKWRLGLLKRVEGAMPL